MKLNTSIAIVGEQNQFTHLLATIAGSEFQTIFDILIHTQKPRYADAAPRASIKKDRNANNVAIDGASPYRYGRVIL